MDAEPSPPGPSPSESEPPAAWQPITFDGVAAFAGAPASRLLLVAALVALLTGAAVTRALYVTWVPAISAAIDNLPARGEIRDGQLAWPAGAPLNLADTSFLAIVVRTSATGPGGQSADVQFELGQTNLTVSSLFGVVGMPFPRHYVIALNRTELAPLWGAWRPHLVAAVLAGTAVALLLVWAALGMLLAPLVRGYASLLQRDVRFGGCARLAMAAFLPGALVLAVAVTAYGMGRLSAAELLLLAALHVLMALGYLLIAPFQLPPARKASPSAGTGAAPTGQNPFAVHADTVAPTTNPSAASGPSAEANTPRPEPSGPSAPFPPPPKGKGVKP